MLILALTLNPDTPARIRDLARKSVHDPLTSINSQLASGSGSGSAAGTEISSGSSAACTLGVWMGLAP